jgi:outer membrane receptor protein involved in Fe transport
MQPTPALTLFARIANVLDRQYATAAQLGPTGFDAAGRFVGQPFPADAQGRSALRNSTFYAPGAPRLFSLGFSYAFD